MAAGSDGLGDCMRSAPVSVSGPGGSASVRVGCGLREVKSAKARMRLSVRDEAMTRAVASYGSRSVLEWKVTVRVRRGGLESL